MRNLGERGTVKWDGESNFSSLFVLKNSVCLSCLRFCFLWCMRMTLCGVCCRGPSYVHVHDRTEEEGFREGLEAEGSVRWSLETVRSPQRGFLGLWNASEEGWIWSVVPWGLPWELELEVMMMLSRFGFTHTLEMKSTQLYPRKKHLQLNRQDVLCTSENVKLMRAWCGVGASIVFIYFLKSLV